MRHKKVASPPPRKRVMGTAPPKADTPPRGTGPAMRAKTARPGSDPAATTVVVMRLYIANNAPNSVQAVANLQAICKQHLADAFKLEIIDVLEFPQRALADGILVTPSLAKVSPAPATRTIGNLSNTASVMRALGIRSTPR